MSSGSSGVVGVAGELSALRLPILVRQRALLYLRHGPARAWAGTAATGERYRCVMELDDVRELHGMALAVVMMCHSGDGRGMARFVSQLDVVDIAGLVAVLAAWTDEAWTVLADRDGTTFEEFTANAGLWLAGGEL